MPSLLLAANIVAGWLLGLALPLELPVPFATRIASGGVLLLFAAGLGAVAIRTMTRAETPIEPNAMPRALVTAGPFRFSRNPLYVALVAASLGIGLMLASGWIVAGTVVLAAALNWYVIPAEEEMLGAQFPDEFAAYRRTVRRWL